MLFAGGGLAAHELRRDEVPRLQAFFDANPEYFLVVNGRPAPPDLAAVEYDERPPPHLSHTRQWCLGLVDEREAGRPGAPLAGVLVVVTDLVLRGVWHIGLFIVATRLHGRGVAAACHAAFEAWARRQGATHLRLGVVLANERALRFWQRQGYRRLREREGVDTGGRVNTVRAMLKPLLDETGGAAVEAEVESALAAYLDAVPRDRPGSTLP